MSHVFPRHSKLNPPTAVSGEGCYLIDASGKRYFDSGDAAVSCLGHSDVEVTKAIKAQLDKLAFAHTGFFTSEPAEELADLLVANAPEGIERVYFVSGGSEATEAAIKLARQYHVEKGEPQRRHLIARKQSYHGNTIGALSAGGNEWRRQQFAPLLIEVSHISPCYEYVLRGEAESAEAYGLRAAQELEDEILRLGPDTVMAFMAEPVVGATLGAVPAVEGYFKRIREICDQYGVLLILDEVMCGMGRTGYLFACEADGVSPDILCIAKGLGAGYQPIGAMLCSGEIYDTIANGTGFFQHGHTYIGHPVATAAGLAVVRALLDRGLMSRVTTMGEKLRSALVSAFGQHPNIGDIRGRGLFIGLEIVANRETKAPFDPSLGIAGKMKKAAFAEGLVCYPMSGTRDGKNGDHVLLAPPFIMTEEQIPDIVEPLRKALSKVL
ncbi:aspartate aminotransferase family protein [Pseudohalocynthiibacter aestuariivivens]|jgi:adenosylmethionine-8-amino-7-oxononanoate aminotransferase|uniref:Aspartate aminotransferase family protein n=1 Tax=Pseudohalocynthiibacter aestuariivivens TaxID=1591409 RepID=A0ABV5JDI2_9RHOB|nr:MULTISPECIES: aspartate aminotransferase family protein [Pseudohalocynthiibacter]MBS9718949.1 aspartate aminotransferase family protein [Pseudohalocynthiibacter aestuariivivens]MCK0104400.1 aspartate aminotransferase family protein [Pseudohalocynthiibacter sp. F2068]